MRTEKQDTLAGATGAGSCKPVTPEGKAAARRNARHYSFLAGILLLPMDNADEFWQTVDRMVEQYQPATGFDHICVQGLIATVWRQRRFQAFERRLLELKGSVPEDASTDQTLKIVHRRLNHLARSFRRDHKSFMSSRQQPAPGGPGSDPTPTAPARRAKRR